MSPAKPTPAQIRDRRAKRAMIVLGVVFVAALAIQGPKLLKMIHKSSPPVNAASVNVQPISGGTATTGSTTVVAASPPALALASGASTTPSQLQGLGRFAVKDPFYAQNVTTTTTTASASATQSAQTTTTAATTTTPATKPLPIGKPGRTTPAPTTTTSPTQFTVTTPAAPPNAAVVLANGKRETVPVGASFPSDAPLFKLNALRQKAPAIRISVVGGSFIDGVKTIPLLMGKTLTFANESDGSHYVIKLVRLTTVAPTGLPPATPAATTASTTSAGG
jgi:hypothetical protein